MSLRGSLAMLSSEVDKALLLRASNNARIMIRLTLLRNLVQLGFHYTH